ncbi:phosphotransferase [Paenibacillus soyae]|uniref:Phosphotransferase n=1 Tax=Paenibacillus soyae TaxID=2969249 RepID=A0A9X2MUM8_9BACL|nr:phosphotransferase [Paenibacillus soyae]MCR2806627.1 phosphotransferase [Paenibacillus soyae]
MYPKLKAQRSVLDPNDLAVHLRGQYDLGEWERCEYWLQGLNDTYRVRTSSGFYVLRVYRATVQEADVSYELHLLTQLSSHLVEGRTRVAEAIPARDGRPYILLGAPEGKRAAALFRYAEGIENVLHDEESCYAFGQSAAELHEAMNRLVMTQPRSELNTAFLIDEPVERVIGYIGASHAAAPFLRGFAESLKERIGRFAAQGLDWGLCHGDMHGNNNAFQQGEGFVHYDFEWAAPGWRAYDLAQVKIRKRLPAEGKERLWASLLSGYRSVRPFSLLDEEAVDTFIWARRLWVMGLDVMFIPTLSGALDYSEDWLEGFVNEFRSSSML